MPASKHQLVSKSTAQCRVLRRRAKKESHPLVSCYDLFTRHGRKRKNLCRNCINYLDFNPKTKRQNEMGKRFYWCLGVSDATDADSSPHSSNDKDSVDATDDCSLHSSNEKVSDTALDINTAHELQSLQLISPCLASRKLLRIDIKGGGRIFFNIGSFLKRIR
jgi:hypothetical protein